MGFFKKRKKTRLFTSKLYLSTLPFLSGFEDGYLVTIFNPSCDCSQMLKDFKFKLWTYTKPSLLVDMALVTKNFDNCGSRFVRFTINREGEALFETPVPVESVTEMTYKAANQVLKERVEDCVKAGCTRLEIESLPSDWFSFQ